MQAALSAPRRGVLAMSYTRSPTIVEERQPRADLHWAAFNDRALAHVAVVPAKMPVVIVNRASAYASGNRCGASQPQPTINFDSSLRISDGDRRRFFA